MISPTPPSSDSDERNHYGLYDLIFILSESDIARGEEVTIGILIIGYGTISDAKLHISPPANFGYHGEYMIEREAGFRPIASARFGKFDTPIPTMGDKNVVTIDLSSKGLQQSSLATPVYPEYGISIETPEPPVQIRIRVGKNAATGDHRFTCALTYFNGREWLIARRSTTLHVPTLYERYEGYAWVVGAFIALVTMGAAVVAAIFAIIGPAPPHP